MKRPYIRFGCLDDFVFDRFANIPEHNEEHTQAQVDECYNIFVQIVFDNGFSIAARRSFPQYGSNRDQSHRLAWEKKCSAWEKKLTKLEKKAWHNEIRFCWQSISRSAEDDMRRAVKRLQDRKER